MGDELVDIVDESNNLTGVQKMKSEALKLGLWHRAAHVWIYNQRGEILLQLRARDKLLYPNMWDISAAGHVHAGEDPQDTAVRELEEEIGIKVRPEELHIFTIKKWSDRFNSMQNNGFGYVYFLKYDGDISRLVLQREEVQKLKFFPSGRLEADLKANPARYVPHGEYWYEAINEVKLRQMR